MRFKNFYLAEENSQKVLEWLKKMDIRPNQMVLKSKIISWMKSFNGNMNDFSNKTFDQFLDKIHTLGDSLDENTALEMMKILTAWGFDPDSARYFPDKVVKDKMGEYVYQTDPDTFDTYFPMDSKSEKLAIMIASSKHPEFLRRFPRENLTDAVAEVLVKNKNDDYLRYFPKEIIKKYLDKK